MPQVWLTVKCENGELDINNFGIPTLYHSIRVRTKDISGKGTVKERVEKAYKFEDGTKGEEWWTTYRYQMEAFVDRVKGRTSKTWVDKEDSVETMKWIERIYEKVRCISSIVLSAVSNPFLRLVLEVDQSHATCTQIRTNMFVSVSLHLPTWLGW